MTRHAILVRRNLVFAALTAAFLLVVLLRPSATSAVRSKENLTPLFPDLKAEDARAISVVRKETKDGKPVEHRLRLARIEGEWKVETAWNHPADPEEVKKFLEKVKGSKEKAEPTRTAGKFGQFADKDGFTEVEILGEGNVPLVKFGIGKTGAGGVWSDTYVRVDPVGAAAKGGATGRMTIATDMSTGIRTDVTDWVERRIWDSFAAADVASLEIHQTEKDRTIVMNRGARGENDTEDPWTVVKPEEGKGTSSAINNLVRSLTGLQMNAVVDSAAGPEAAAKYGFDKPEIVVTATGKPGRDGKTPVWKLVIGKKVDQKEARYVRPTEGEKDSAWVYEVSDWDVRDFRSEPSQWIEKKEEPKKPEEPAMGDTPAMEGEPGMTGEPGMDGEPAMDGSTPPPPPPPAPPAPPPTPEPGMEPGGMDSGGMAGDGK